MNILFDQSQSVSLPLDAELHALTHSILCTLCDLCGEQSHMIRFALRRISTFPLILLLANFIGFAFAFYFEPVVASSNPYISGEVIIPPIFPEYAGYIAKFAELDFGTTYNGEPVLEAIRTVEPQQPGAGGNCAGDKHCAREYRWAGLLCVATA